MNELQYLKVLNPLAKKGVIKLFFFQPRRNDRTTEKINHRFWKALYLHTLHIRSSTNHLSVLSIKWLLIYGTVSFLKAWKAQNLWQGILGLDSLSYGMHFNLPQRSSSLLCYELFFSCVLCTCHVWPSQQKGKSIQQHYCLKNCDFHVLCTQKML